MKKNKRFRSPWFAGLVLFQALPIALILLNLQHQSKRTADAGWISSEDGQCKVFTNYNYQNRSFNWTGDCLNGYANGYGELELLEDGRRVLHLKGSLTNGKVEGKASMQYLDDGDLYEGNFEHSTIQGIGHFYNDDGDHYEGTYEKGSRSGNGIYWYPPESPLLKYEGEWRKNRQHGFGRLYYRNGKIETGVFKEGELVEKLPTKPPSSPPKNILITNDDGIEDMARLQCLAEAFSGFADKILIAVSNQNRSSTSNLTQITKEGYVKVKELAIDTVRQIYTYQVEGYPGDCVLFGALGFFMEQGETIDLVVSGINGGGNIGVEWFGSGTIGAARTAALAKIPAIAVSGIDEDRNEGKSLPRICQWVAELLQSPIIESIKPLEYLTVSIPEDIDQLKGVKVLERAITFDAPPFFLEKSSSEATTETDHWQLRPLDRADVYDLKAHHDVSLYYQNYIVLVPMSVDENMPDRLPSYQQYEGKIPTFPK
ncbi:MAG: hypothetical protein KTR30_04420 [Saprospiraceae bacterium]|nr:hypothetical protein [Saprospiraceae bacterium]